MSFTETLYEELEATLGEIAISAPNMLQKAGGSLDACHRVMQQLKARVLEEGFASQDEEVHFFKQVKPRFASHPVFFRELYQFEKKRPVGTKEALVSYHQEALTRVRLFFCRHEELYNYYRLNRSDQDRLFFLRSASTPDESPEFDSRFCTATSYERAKILAMEAFLEHLIQELHVLEHGHTLIAAQAKERPQLIWTESKVAFIELVYALQSSGSVNHGKASVAQVMAALGSFLQIDAGNFYAVFQQNIRIRKKERAVFLNFLTESLEKRMDESDENPKYK